MKKYGLRVFVSAFIYLFFRITSETPDGSISNDATIWPIILTFTIVVVLTIWEVCDQVIIYYSRNYPHYLASSKKIAFIFIMATLATFPLVIAFVYFENYYLKVWLECINDSRREFFTDITQGFVVTWLVISVELLKVYYKHAQNLELERNRMQKEILRTQYESLKNQVNPHFLFNNFSVLDALIHRNVDLASEFLAQLSKLYRYILDNKENEMVSLSKEFEFLNAYIFLLKIRHEDSIKLEFDINIDPENFYVPTLSLQMLIENAVKHNSFSEGKPLTIKIFNEKDEFIIVQNIVSPKIGIASSTKIGLENIKNRYTFKSERKVIVDQSDELFKVKLPMLTKIAAN